MATAVSRRRRATGDFFSTRSPAPCGCAPGLRHHPASPMSRNNMAGRATAVIGLCVAGAEFVASVPPTPLCKKPVEKFQGYGCTYPYEHITSKEACEQAIFDLALLGDQTVTVDPNSDEGVGCSRRCLRQRLLLAFLHCMSSSIGK